MTIVSLAVRVSMNVRLAQSLKVINIPLIRICVQNAARVQMFVLLKQSIRDNVSVNFVKMKRGCVKVGASFFIVLLLPHGENKD